MHILWNKVEKRLQLLEGRKILVSSPNRDQFEIDVRRRFLNNENALKIALELLKA